MKKECEISDDKLGPDYLGVENILRPRAEFRVSPGFRERVMAEAQAKPVRRFRRRLVLVASSAAAAVAALVIFSMVYFRSSELPADTPSTVTVSTTKLIPASVDSLKKDMTAVRLIAEVPQPIREKKPTQNQIAVEKSGPAPVVTSASVKGVPEAKNQPHAAEGEMTQIRRSDRPIDPDEVRLRLLESRRNAEIASLERMREMISITRLHGEQLKSE